MTNTTPLVSIIIPTFNRAHLIGETLDSVMAQTYQNWECIVVDDGSTDNTEELMAEYVAKDSRFQYHHRPKNRMAGGNAARNYGFELCKGEYVNWFDDDDLMTSDFIEQKVSFHTESVQLVIAEGWYLLPDGSKEIMKVKQSENLYKDYILWKTSIITNSVLFKRAFLETGPLFNEFILKGQESEFFSRLFYNIKNDAYKIINLPLFYYRRHGETKSEFDKLYNAPFKFSTATNHISNLERAFEKNDLELVRYFYKKCLKMLYSALNNSDKKTSSYILEKFKQLLMPQNPILYFKIKYFVQIGIINQKLNTRLFKHLKHNLPKI